MDRSGANLLFAVPIGVAHRRIASRRGCLLLSVCGVVRFLFACMLFDNFDTCITFYVAAPVEFAVATFFDNNFLGIVATTTA